MAPTWQMRAQRELEPPGDDEGFGDVEHVPFERAQPSGGAAVSRRRCRRSRAFRRDLDRSLPHLVFDWRPGGAPADLDPEVAALAAVVTGPIEAALCAHPAGPPTCWCRPPLPGFALDFARRHGVDPARIDSSSARARLIARSRTRSAPASSAPA